MTANKPFTWQRIKMYPNSGNMFLPDGNVYDYASFLAMKEYFDITGHTVGNGNIAILSIRLEGLASGIDHYFVIDIPVGKKFILSERLLVMSEGRYFVDAVAVDSYTQSASVNNGIIAGMDKTRPVICDTRLRHDITSSVTNPVVREYGFIDTGAGQTGQSRMSSTTESEQHFKILQGPSCLRVKRTTDGTFTANLTYIGWELNS